MKSIAEIQLAIDALLKRHNIDAKVSGCIEGPSITRFNLQLEADVRFIDIVRLGEFFARELRLEREPLIGQNYKEGYVTVDLESSERKPVFLTDLPQPDPNCKLPLVLGVDVAGCPVIEDLTQIPHLLVGGRTGSGKSVALRTFATSLLTKYNSAKDLKLALIDPKGVEFANYDDLDQLYGPDGHKRATNVESAIELLTCLCRLMDFRFSEFAIKTKESGLSITSLADYRSVAKENGWEMKPYVVLIIDELADLVMCDTTLSSQFTQLLCRLAQKSRAAGIHIIAATQRPSREVVTGLIKANFPARIAFQVASDVDSTVIFGEHNIGAENLFGKGDMLYQSATGTITRIQGAMVSKAAVTELVTERTKVLKFKRA